MDGSREDARDWSEGKEDGKEGKDGKDGKEGQEGKEGVEALGIAGVRQRVAVDLTAALARQAVIRQAVPEISRDFAAVIQRGADSVNGIIGCEWSPRLGICLLRSPFMLRFSMRPLKT
jgi:hypothetical protein